MQHAAGSELDISGAVSLYCAAELAPEGPGCLPERTSYGFCSADPDMC